MSKGLLLLLSLLVLFGAVETMPKDGIPALCLLVLEAKARGASFLLSATARDQWCRHTTDKQAPTAPKAIIDRQRWSPPPSPFSLCFHCHRSHHSPAAIPTHLPAVTSTPCQPESIQERAEAILGRRRRRQAALGCPPQAGVAFQPRLPLQSVYHPSLSKEAAATSCAKLSGSPSHMNLHTDPAP